MSLSLRHFWVAASLVIVYLAVGIRAQGKLYTATQLACLPFVAFEGASVLTKSDLLACLAANQGATGPSSSTAQIPTDCTTYLTSLAGGTAQSNLFTQYWSCLKTNSYNIIQPSALSISQAATSGSGNSASGTASGTGSVTTSITVSTGGSSSSSSSGTSDNTASGSYCTLITDATLKSQCTNMQLMSNTNLTAQAKALSQLYQQQ